MDQTCLEYLKRVIVIPAKVRITNPEDLRAYIVKTLRIIDSDGHKTIIEKTGAIAQLANAWTRSWELEKNEEILRRLDALESKQKDRELRAQYA